MLRLPQTYQLDFKKYFKIIQTLIFLSVLFFVMTLPVEAANLSSASMAHPGLLNESEFYNGIQKVSPAELHQLLPETKNKAVFLEFRSKFCKACKQMDPILKQLLPKYPNIEKKVLDIARDKKQYEQVFNAYKPAVVPIQLYMNTNGEVVNVFYDYHDEKHLDAALSCINPGVDNTGCENLVKLSQSEQHDWLAQTMVQITNQINVHGQSHSLGIIIMAFIGGVVTSFFPCTVALLPVLVGCMGGYSADNKWTAFIQVSLFILGLATVMTILGVILSASGQAFGLQNNTLVYALVGVLCVVMSLQLWGLFHIPLPQFVKQLPDTQEGTLLSFYILGCAFGVIASPCGTPVLAAILAVIGKEGNILLGAVALFFYALGQGVLLMIVGMFTGFLKHKALLMRTGVVLTRLSACLLFLVGLAYVAQSFGLIPDWLK